MCDINVDCVTSCSKSSKEKKMNHRDIIKNSLKPLKRVKKQLLTPRLAATLDKCQVSERNVVHLIKTQKLNGKKLYYQHQK